MTTQKFQALLEKGWSLDHIFVLENILDPASYPKKDVLMQTLYRKGMIDGDSHITEQGNKLLEFAHDELVSEITTIARPKISEGLAGLHTKLEERILQLTGKKQVRVNILGKTYPFLCGKEDLESRVKKVMIKYKLSEYQPIEDCLLGYIATCNRRKNWSPLLMYYIIKQKEGIETSQMVTEMRNYMDNSTQAPKTDFEI